MQDILVESFSGIRGIYGQSLTDKIAQEYAEVYAQYLTDKHAGKIKVVIGRDTRKSGERLKKIFTEFFLNCGYIVIDAGVTSTPTIEFAVRHYKARGGIIITASHNEPEFNGWKLLGSDSAILNQKEIGKIIEQVHSQTKINLPKRKGVILHKQDEIQDLYVNDILKIIGRGAVKKIRQKNYKILADPNGGPVKKILEKLFEKLGVELVGVNMRPGVFIRKIEPNTETLEYLIPIITNAQADFGFGLDGDADRMEMILPNGSKYVASHGNMVSGNEMAALGIESVLLNKRLGQKIVINNCTANLIYELAKKYQARVKEVDVGETNVVSKMAEIKSVVAGEGSNGGLIIYPAKCRDGILSVAAILALLAHKNQSLPEILGNYPHYFEKRAQVRCEKGKDVELKNKLIKYFENKGFKTRRAEGNAGGIKILYNKNNWLFFRASQTEPGLFRIIANGDDKKLVDKMIKEGEKIFYKLKQ